MTIKAIVHEEDGGYWAEVPGMPGCVTEGDTMDEIVANLREAVEGWMGAHQDLHLEAEGGPVGSRAISLDYAFSHAAVGEPTASATLLKTA